MIQLNPHIKQFFFWTQIIFATVYLCGAAAVFNYPPICRALPSLLEKFLHVVLWVGQPSIDVPSKHHHYVAMTWWHGHGHGHGHDHDGHDGHDIGDDQNVATKDQQHNG